MDTSPRHQTPAEPATLDPVRDLSSLAARSFSSLAEAVDAVLRAITAHLGVRTSYVTRIERDAQSLEVLLARNLPGGSEIEAGATAPLQDTY